MELNVTPLQFRAVTYAAVVNKTHSWKETRLRVREGWAVLRAASDHSPWRGGLLHSSSLHFYQGTHCCPNGAPVSDLLFRWTLLHTLMWQHKIMQRGIQSLQNETLSLASVTKRANRAAIEGAEGMDMPRGGKVSAASTTALLLPYTDEGPRRMSPMSVLFLKSSALMLLVFDHWNKENEMISGFPFPKAFSEGSYYEVSAQGESHTPFVPYSVLAALF